MLKLISTYAVAGGGRHVVLVTIDGPDCEDAFIVIDIPVDPEVKDDARMVGSGFETHGAAWSAAIRHAICSERLGHPAVPVNGLAA